MRNKLFVIPAIGIIGIIVAFLLSGGLTANTVFYLFPDEAVAQRADFENGRVFRLGGNVLPDSVESGTETTFSVGDGGTVITVVTDRTPPQLFDDDVPVLLEGYWDGDRFRATQIIIRHDEQYTPPEESNASP